MIKDFKQGKMVENIWYEALFDDGHNNGYAFPCDENGNVEPQSDAAKENYEWCLQNKEKFVRFNKVVKYRQHYREPNSGICKCGERIELVPAYLGACDCPNCGQWYNAFGQELNDSSTWEDGDDY